ncbi:lysine transporter LysE [candidate division GN15 bacterium]|nr:lysine transporter LysE [candidate division GN15 bacterium]
MELISLFFLSFGVGFSGAMMPGPLLAVGIAETPRHGWQTGPVISIGHAIAEIGVVVLLALGVAAVAQHPTVTSTISIVGGVALVLMGATMAIDILRGRVNYDSQADKPKGGHRLLMGKGITASLSNPYWFVWWATTGLAFVTKSLEFGFIGPIVFYFGHIMSDFVWFSLVSALLWQGKRLIMGTGLKVLILACAAFLVFLGISFFIDGITEIS